MEHFYSLTKKQRFMDTKINQIEQTKQNLLALISNIEKASNDRTRIDKVEGDILESVLQMGKNMLSHYIELVKNKTENSLSINKEQGCQNKGLMKRTYFSIFGEVEYERRKYYVSKKKDNFSIG